ncbi:M23 family metallopeptidase [Ornithinimicrobium sp. F0845]|uniref:M23 family metallopeptidase n=1 Tax=Ornithinimicrobium sp. F0845 TaxID=2926412 RepID=UPI001FF5D249|nr:M23 family metallopeptidase [Ornithinimicrobium sp. F0845]
MATTTPQSRREAKALAATTPRSRREARALAELSRRTSPSPVRALTHRVVAPVVVTALVAAGGATAVVGLPTKVAAGLPGQSLSAGTSPHLTSSTTSGTPVSGSLADGPLAGSGAVLTDLRQSSTSASRGSMHRLTLAWGTAAVVEGRRLMTARVQTMESSITAGVTATDEACAEARGLAHDLAFHEPILEGRKTSGYGWRWGRMHNGTDFGADVGTELYAVGRGTVSAAGWNSGLGYHVKITLDTGELIVYGHMSRITATLGDRVVPGTTIGAVGSTGNSTGAHLHLEVRTSDGPIDPLPWLNARRA